ncbi:MAG: DUF1845 family protein [Burkholderiaceae bacterium]|jgi:hypothetical protein|nr:DUF1845 family protein [Burkholderiaceae bacterium]
MSDIQIIKMDQGGANARIIAKEAKADFRRVEAASLKIPSRFTSADGKRYFVRLFNTLQLNTHFISVIARTRLDHDDIAQIETAIRTRMESVTENLNKAIDGAEALFKANGITCAATYDTVPMDVQVGVLSSSGRRFLEVLGKLDQLMPLLQTLEIHEVISAYEVDIQRAALKRQVREVANGARNFAMGLRRRMNALGSRDEEVAAIDAAPEAAAETDGAAAEPTQIAAAEAEREVAVEGDTEVVSE